MGHYWVIDQAEFATDLCFVSKHALAGLFLRLLEFALLTFTPKKVFQLPGPQVARTLRRRSANSLQVGA